MSDTDTRTARIQGLRNLADALDADTSLPLPHEVTVGRLCFFVHDNLRQALKLRGLMGIDAVTKHDTSDTFPVDITGVMFGLPVKVYISAQVALVDRKDAVKTWPVCDPRLGLDTPQVAS